MNPSPLHRETLTGFCRVRRGWFGRLILMVEVRVEALDLLIPPMPPLKDELPGAFRARVAEHQQQGRKVIGSWHEWREARGSDFQAGAAMVLK